MGVLAGGIAHDFNNILTMLFGNISIAKSKFSEGLSGIENLEKAEEAFQRASRLTNQLLTFSKGGNPVKKTVDLNKLIKEVTQFDLTGSNVKLDCKSVEKLCPVDVDEGQIEQLFIFRLILMVFVVKASGKIFTWSSTTILILALVHFGN